mgnify:CR=1 FL=1
MNNLRRNLMRLSVVLVGVGMLAAAGCDSCSSTDTGGSAIPTQISYTCGPGTHQEGNVCVNNAAAPARATMPVNP